MLVFIKENEFFKTQTIIITNLQNQEVVLKQRLRKSITKYYNRWFQIKTLQSHTSHFELTLNNLTVEVVLSSFITQQLYTKKKYNYEKINSSIPFSTALM